MPHDSSLALVMATELEAAPFIERLALALEAEKPFSVYRKGDRILVVSGIGKTNAAIAATYTILTYSPAQICNLGAAGGMKTGFELGDICHIDTVIEYDRPHLRSGKMRIMSPYVLAGFRCATVATQDKPVVDLAHRRTVAGCADLADMEAAGVVRAAQKLAVPCVVFKFVSDTIDHDRHEDIVENIKEHREGFCDFFLDKIFPVLRTA